MTSKILQNFKGKFTNLAAIKADEVDFYYEYAQSLALSISKILVTFAVLHEISHIINHDMDDEQDFDRSAEKAADEFALKFIDIHLDDAERAILGLVLTYTQIYLTTVDIAWLQSEETVDSKEFNERIRLSQEKTSCSLNLFSKRTELPLPLIRYLTSLQEIPRYRCGEK